MYPYITLGEIKIYMMGLGVVIGLILFLWVLRFYCKKRGMDFHLFLRKFPVYLLITYLLGTYSFYLITELVVFPLNWEYILLYLTPYGYKFHYIGVVIGILLSGHWFFQHIPNQQRPLRVSAFAHALLLMLIPLGIGFVLGDNFIGQTTQGGVYVSAILQDSDLAAFDRVIPLGLYVALFGLISHLAASWYEQHTQSPKGYLIMAWIAIWFGFLLLFQQYPRHLVVRFLGVSRDIKQYFSLVIAVGFFLRYHVQKRLSTKLP